MPKTVRQCPTCDRIFAGPVRHCSDDGSLLEERVVADDSLVGRIIDDRFTILREIGAGGMGTVYVAHQHSVGRQVALKILDSPQHDKSARARFLREARAASQLTHPNTITIFDFGESADGLLYIAMELLRGRSLREALVLGGAMPPERIVRILTQVCDSLGEAHEQGIIHRDLKPDNVYLTDHRGRQDVVKVLDFGIARLLDDTKGTPLTKSRALIGTPGYMSPEVGQGIKADARSDIYAIGVMLFEMLCGQPPFEGSFVSVLMKHISKPVPPIARVNPKVPIAQALADLIGPLMAKDPGERPQNVDAVAAALTEALARHKSEPRFVPIESGEAFDATVSGAVAVPGPPSPEHTTAGDGSGGDVTTAPGTSPTPGSPPSDPAMAYEPPPVAKAHRWPLAAGILAVIAAVLAVLAFQGPLASGSGDESAEHAAAAAGADDAAGGEETGAGEAAKATSDEAAAPEAAAEAPAPPPPQPGAKGLQPTVAAHPRILPRRSEEHARRARAIPEPRAQRLLVESTPPGATVQLGGDRIGKAPQHLARPPEGKRVTITVSYPGHLPATRPFPTDDRGVLHVTLKPKPKPTGPRIFE